MTAIKIQSPGGSLQQVQINSSGAFSGSSDLWVDSDKNLYVSGSVIAQGLSGSLTQLADGTSYLIAGDNVAISSASNGSITISSVTSSVQSGADPEASYVVMGVTASLLNERALTVGTGLTLTDAGSGSTATLAVDPSSTTNINIITSDPSGFYTLTGSQLSAISGTRTFTIEPVISAYDFYIKGTRFEKTGSNSVTWTNTEGLHFFYFDLTGTLTSTTNTDIWTNILKGSGALVSSLYWDALNNKNLTLFEERHGFMPGATHAELHFAFGAQWISGGALSNITTDGSGDYPWDASFDVSGVEMMDEDLDLTFTNGSPQNFAPSASIPIFYRSGSLGNWRKKDANEFPLIYDGIIPDYTAASGRAPYNQNTGTEWKLTEVSQNDFFLVHYYVTNDLNEPVIGVQGQNIYTSVRSARNGAEEELTSLSGILYLLANENAPLGTVIYQTSTGYSNNPSSRIRSTEDGNDYIDFRGNKFRGATSPAGVTDHGLLNGLNDNDHTQYYHVSGTNNLAADVNISGFAFTVTGSNHTSATYSARFSDDGTKGIILLVRNDGLILVPNIPSGSTQTTSGAVTGSLWKTESHDTLPDGVLMVGI